MKVMANKMTNINTSTSIQDTSSLKSRSVSKTENGTTSTVFRVEKLDGCCATFRVLEKNPDQESVYPYVATNSFFTMNLGCVCCLRCLDDTFVECI